MFEVIPYTEKRKWEEVMEGLLHKDIFYFHSYCNLYPTLGDGDPYLFMYDDDKGNQVYYVFFKRNIPLLPFSEGLLDKEEYFDIITPPYGYGGPICNEDNPQLIYDFRKAFEEYCQYENIISEFIRFHPVYQNHKYLEELMDISFNRETVFIDLKRSEEDIFQHYHKNHKRNLNKASNNQLEFRIFVGEDAIKQVDSFYSLYKETMDKLNASAYSYFSTDYIRSLLTNLTNNSLIASTFYEGKMVAASLCIFEGGYMHYHLGCSKKELLRLGVNVFLFHSLSIWAKSKGFHTFHLGGGHVGRDSLFEFKYRFNSTSILDFYIGNKIHHPEKYNKLVDMWEQYYSQKADDSFFPIYRAKPSNVIPVK